MGHSPAAARHAVSGRVGIRGSSDEPVSFAAMGKMQDLGHGENGDQHQYQNGGNTRRRAPRTQRSEDRLSVSYNRYRQSGSHYWNRTKTAVLGSSNRSSTHFMGLTSTAPLHDYRLEGQQQVFALDFPLHVPVVVTRDEFETLPPAIQRKQFSNIEQAQLFKTEEDLRRLAVQKLLPPRSASAPPPISADESTHRQQPSASGHGRQAIGSIEYQARHLPRLRSIDQKSNTDKDSCEDIDEEEQFIARQQPSTFKPLPKAQPLQSERRLLRPSYSAYSINKIADMPSRYEDNRPATAQARSSREDPAFFRSLQWLEQNDGPDLRLYFDGAQDTNQDDAQSKPSRRPSYRRHLSLSKMPFKRPSLTQSRPGTKDTMIAPSFRSTQSVAHSAPGHSRRKSLGLSMMLNRQQVPEPITVDPAAAHYQDPEARMKLRALMTSPQKFDEALEFGFPTLDDEGTRIHEIHHEEEEVDPLDQLKSFLDDDKSSTYSDPSTMADPDSPKTPPMLDKPLPLLPIGGTFGDALLVRPQDCSNGPGGREMTLRMTLTRPDLRANDEDIYKWQQSVEARKAHMRGEVLAPVSVNKPVDPKARIESELAALDEENYMHNEGGMVKRFWKRVRRA